MKPVNMQGSSDTSSEETDHNHQEDQDDDSTSAKRSYDCTFCRRGFTNAQALGGHMNIHRKDKAKAKRGTPNSSSLPNKFTNEESPFIPQIPSQTSTCYTIFEPHQRNCDNIRFQPSSAPNYPINPPAYAFQYELLNPTRYHQSLGSNQELLGPNLSLQIGPSHVNTDQVRRGIQKDGEVVDLELRLGHDPY